MRIHFLLLWPAACLLVGCVTPEIQQERERLRVLSEGHQMFRRGAHAEARDRYSLALQMGPNDPDTLFHLAECATALKNPKEAEGLYLRCLSRDNGHEGARAALVSRMLADGRVEDARATVQAWLASQPGSPGPYVEDGLMRLRDGDLDSARGRFQQAIDIDPVHPRALRELGKIYERIGHSGRALVCYEMAAQGGDAEAAGKLAELRKKGIVRPFRD